jgi:hypothetical protein
MGNDSASTDRLADCRIGMQGGQEPEAPKGDGLVTGLHRNSGSIAAAQLWLHRPSHQGCLVDVSSGPCHNKAVYNTALKESRDEPKYKT